MSEELSEGKPVTCAAPLTEQPPCFNSHGGNWSSYLVKLSVADVRVTSVSVPVRCFGESVAESVCNTTFAKTTSEVKITVEYRDYKLLRVYQLSAVQDRSSLHLRHVETPLLVLQSVWPVMRSSLGDK